MNVDKPFVRWDDLDSVIFGNKAGSGKRTVPALGEITINQNDELNIPEYRRLACESYKFFLNIHGDIPSADDEEVKPECLTSAEAKRTCMLYSEMLQSILFEKIENNLKDERDQQFCNELKVFEMFLSMSSFVIFGDKAPRNNAGLCYELAEWVKIRQPCGEQLRDECLKSIPPNRSESFWPAVYCLLIVGDLYGAVHLLRLHESSHLPDFGAAIEVVEAFARLHADLAGLAEEANNASMVMSPNSGVRVGSASVISGLKNSWHGLTEAARVIADKISVEKHGAWQGRLSVVTELLAGNESAFADLKQYCDTWYQLLVPRLLYVDPFVTCSGESTPFAKTPTKQSANDLTKHAKWCLSYYFGSSPALSPSDSLFYSLLTRDLGQLTKGIGENFSNWWLLAHLLDILQLSSSSLERTGWILQGDAVLSASKQSSKQLTLSQLREMRNFAVLEYATSLVNDCDLWPIAAGYLANITPPLSEDDKKSNIPSGRDLASFLIRRVVVRFSSVETLDRALGVCNRLGLADCYADLCVAEANRLFGIAKSLPENSYELQGCKKEWLLVSAISWAARPGDVVAAREAADAIVCELLTSTSCKILSDSKSAAIWEAVYMTAVSLLSCSSSIYSSSLPYLNLAVRLYELHKAPAEEAIELLGKVITAVVSAGMLSESAAKAENLNGLLALQLRSILQGFVSNRSVSHRLPDSFLLSLAKCVRDVSGLPQQQMPDNDLNKLLMIAIRQNTSSW